VLGLPLGVGDGVGDLLARQNPDLACPPVSTHTGAAAMEKIVIAEVATRFIGYLVVLVGAMWWPR
jgi:hypothetical protein